MWKLAYFIKMTINSTPSDSRNVCLSSGSAKSEQRQLKMFSINSTSSPFAGSFFRYRYTRQLDDSPRIRKGGRAKLTAATWSSVSIPSSSATFNAIPRPSCKMIDKISLAYCLLLSYSFLAIRFNSQGSNVVLSTSVSARGGMNDKRFSNTPRMWKTP